MRKTKMLSVITAVILMFSLFGGVQASALTFTPTNGKDADGEPVPISFYSQSIYMVNASTGEPLVDINSDQKLSPGYLNQMMTCALVLDKFQGNEKKLKNNYVIGENDAYDELYETGAPTADIRPYESVSYYDLLASMILCSSCEAANIVAMNLAGSLFDFTSMMNEKATELGMENTKFSSAHGNYSVQNYTTAKDFSKLCRYIINNYTIYNDIASMEIYQLEATDVHEIGTTIYNNNYLINTTSEYYYSDVRGMKSSTQESSGRNLASYASYDGNSYVIVSLNAPIEKTPADVNKGIQNPNSIYAFDYVYYNMLDHIHLYDWAFNSLVLKDFVNTNSEITDAKVEFGIEADYVNLKPKSSYSIMWPYDLSEDKVEKKVTVYENIIAPIEKDDVLGKMELIYEGNVIATIDLIATSGVTRSKSSSELKIASAFFRSTEFKWAIFLMIMVVTIYSVGFFVFLQLKYLRVNKKTKKIKEPPGPQE